MKYILGSGVVAMLARDILGPDWTIIPFYKSRFFSFNPSLDDNFMVANKEVDCFVSDKFGKVQKFQYNRAYSIRGLLYQNHDDGICMDWASNLFGVNTPSHISAYMKHNMELEVYDLRVNELYSKYLETTDISKGSELGRLTAIKDKTLVFEGGKRVDYENIVSTIPLNVLFDLCGVSHDLKAKPVHFMHVFTEHLDFEGSNQVMVVDKMFSFFKVSNIAKNRYLFYFNEEIPYPGQYFMSFLKDFDILDGTSIKDYLVLGEMPILDIVEKLGIHCVGSYAQWDHCMDVSSCVLRLIKYAQRGFVEKKPI